MNTSTWPEYVDALQALARAPAAGDDRRRTIDDQLTTARKSADDEHAHVVTTQERLEEQIRQLRSTIDQAMHDDGIAVDGPAASVGVPAPESIAEARGSLTRLERQLAADQRALASARSSAARERLRQQQQRRLTLVVAAVGLLILVVIVFAVVAG
ncbi:MAG: hypothetical protein GEV07_28365 [Streptosporangiales bacterium]|nr:hypothetical protein [Streptosporangiales bacterium]